MIYRSAREFAKMILLVFLLGPVSLTSAAENGTSDPGFVIDANQKLVSITSPSIDLDLSGLGLLSLDAHAFANCASARSLDLSSNSLRDLPEDVFSPLANLERLSLARNDLDGKAMVSAFLRLANLKTLDVTHNPLSRILENGVFAGLPNSCEIHIGESRNFRSVTPGAFPRIKKPVPKNRTIGPEVQNCSDRLDDRIDRFDRESHFGWAGYRLIKKWHIEDQPYSDEGVKLCPNGTAISFVVFSNISSAPPPTCSTLLLQDHETRLSINDKVLKSFEAGWFRIRNTSVTAIDVILRFFDTITRDLLNDLPENIRYFSMNFSILNRVPKGLLVNEHLRGLDLAHNRIRTIEADAFAGMKLTHLRLSFNPILALDWAPSLPETLLWLSVEYTAISEIPVASFSQLKNLLALNLNANRATKLVPGCFDGLGSLQRLDLALGRVTDLPTNLFRHLSKLHRLDLHRNNISRVDKGAFNDLGCLTGLDLGENHLKRIDEGAFDGLTDRLRTMDLHHNELETLQAGGFVGIPKISLSLRENRIRKIWKGTFDLPYLTDLDLRMNGLTTIEKGAAKSLGSLADGVEINLGFNSIARLENGALGGLPGNACVTLAVNPVRVIQAGVFEDS